MWGERKQKEGRVRGKERVRERGCEREFVRGIGRKGECVTSENENRKRKRERESERGRVKET